MGKFYPLILLGFLLIYSQVSSTPQTILISTTQSTLTDDFNDNTIDPIWSIVDHPTAVGPNENIREVNQHLELDVNGTQSGWGYVRIEKDANYTTFQKVSITTSYNFLSEGTFAMGSYDSSTGSPGWSISIRDAWTSSTGGIATAIWRPDGTQINLITNSANYLPSASGTITFTVEVSNNQLTFTMNGTINYTDSISGPFHDWDKIFLQFGVDHNYILAGHYIYADNYSEVNNVDTKIDTVSTITETTTLPTNTTTVTTVNTYPTTTITEISSFTQILSVPGDPVTITEITSITDSSAKINGLGYSMNFIILGLVLVVTTNYILRSKKY